LQRRESLGGLIDMDSAAASCKIRAQNKDALVSFAPLTTAPQTARLIVHAAESWYDDVAGGRFDFFTKLGDRAEVEGYAPALARAGTPLSNDLLQDQRHLHLIIGPRSPQGPRIWHVHPAYLRGFWYLDPLGVNMRSSLVHQTFAPERIDAKTARYFFDGVVGWNLRKNVSKFPQNARNDLPPAYAVIFAQDLEHFANPVHYISTEKILRIVARRAEGARVYVKPHPKQGSNMAKTIATQVARFGNLELTSASIHDLSAASARVVTQNSAAGFEALMQRKSVITCAECDYHHATHVARTPQDLKAALDAPAVTVDFPRYLYWVLVEAMLETSKPEFADRAWARMMPQSQ
jgi:hypothetical protein